MKFLRIINSLAHSRDLRTLPSLAAKKSCEEAVTYRTCVFHRCLFKLDDHKNVAYYSKSVKRRLVEDPDFQAEETTKPFDGRTLGAKRTIRNIREALGCSSKEAEILFARNPELKFATLSGINEIVFFLQNNGVLDEQIKENAWVLSQKPKTLAAQLVLVKRMLKSEDFNVILPLLQIPLQKLKTLLYKWDQEVQGTNYANRIAYLAEKLECEPRKIANLLLSMPFLATLSFTHLQRVMDKFLEYSMRREDILKDMWVFRVNEELISNRIKRAYDAGVMVIKPWMMRCPEKTFESALQRRRATRELLGDHQDVLMYLKDRLECDYNFVESLVQRNPRLPQVNVGKLKEILDYLFSEGYSPRDVRIASRIFCHSLHTIQTRLQELKDLGYCPVSLHILYRSQAQYDAIVDKLIAREKARKKEG